MRCPCMEVQELHILVIYFVENTFLRKLIPLCADFAEKKTKKFAYMDNL